MKLDRVLSLRSGIPSSLAVIVLLGFLLRVGSAFLGTLTIGDITYREADSWYASYAINMLEGHGYGLGPGQPSTFYPPMYAFLLTALWAPFGNNYELVWFAQAVLSTVPVVFTYLLARELFDHRKGLVAATLVALYPSLVLYVHFDDVATLYTAFLIPALYFLVRGIKTLSFTVVAIAGILFGFAVLTRSEWMWAVVCIAVLLPFIRKRWPVRLSLVLLVTFLIVVAPWLVRNSLVVGRPTLFVSTTGGYDIFLSNNTYTPMIHSWEVEEQRGEHSAGALLERIAGPQTPENEYRRHSEGIKYAAHYALDNSWQTLKRAFNRIGDLWMPERLFLAFYQEGYYEHPMPALMAVGVGGLIFAAYALVLISGSLGMVWAPKETDGKVLVFLLGWGLLVSMVVFAHPRIHIPQVPILAVFASYGILERKAILQCFKKRLLLTCFTGALWLVILLIWLREIIAGDIQRFFELLR